MSLQAQTATRSVADLFKPATAPRGGSASDRLLVIDPQRGSFGDATVGDLQNFILEGDLVILNDAATLPSSLTGQSERESPIEIRLCGGDRGGQYRAVLLGAGDWRTPTEHRPPPEPLAVGDRVLLGHGFWATIEVVEPVSPRLVRLRFNLDGASLWQALYRHGRPVQYAYMGEPLPLWSVQNCYACRPWAAERPSAGRPLTVGQLVGLSRRGAAIATITHAAGLSSTGDPAIDAALPLPEWYDIPAATIAAIERARARGGRIIAVGTTVVRSLEGCVARHGQLRPGEGETDLVIGPEHRLQVVDSLLTGLHEPTVSHHKLLMAFVPAPLLRASYEHAGLAGYLGHEFGDVSLMLPRALPMPSGRRSRPRMGRVTASAGGRS
jgi:S-adenosylmethionine:tRNA ribosyltransferase-isomerase